jgi:hypothetical protein
MADKSIEDRVTTLEKLCHKLAHENERLQAVVDIQNLMGRYESIHNMTDITKSWELFARHTPDTWIEVANWGLVEGIDEIRNMWLSMVPKSDYPLKGLLFEHPLATPIIEVAGNGETAKATWVSPGHETKLRDGRLQAHWCWGKYAIDFVKEDGEWRIWHFKWFRGFITPFDISWVDRPRELEFAAQVETGCLKKPSVYHKPYFPDSVPESIPPAPKPYDAWTDADKGWHLKPSEHP